MNKEKPGKYKKNFIHTFECFCPTIIGYWVTCRWSPTTCAQHSSCALLEVAMPCLRWLCDGACLPPITWEGIPMQTNGRISFLAKKETHSPEHARGNSYKSRGRIPKELPRIAGEGFLTKRVEALH
jgi:hypothetical protein